MTTRQQILFAHTKFGESLIEIFTQMNVQDDDEFALMIRAVLRFTSISGIDMADRLGLIHSSIQRWASRKASPQAFLRVTIRDSLIEMLREQVTENGKLLDQTEPEPLPQKYKPIPTF